MGQSAERILPDDTIATLYARIEEKGLGLLACYMPKIADGTARLFQQDESKRRVMPQRSPEDGLIDWDACSMDVDRFVRAQTRPYPGAFTNMDGKKLTIWTCRPSREVAVAKSGRVIKEGDRYLVKCGRGMLELVEVSYAGEDFGLSLLSELLGGGGQLLA